MTAPCSCRERPAGGPEAGGHLREIFHAVFSVRVSGLAVIAAARRTGFPEALRALPRLGREAKRHSWQAAVGAAEGGPR